ncbi:toxin-antitoxin system YwqK family antitoxin [Flavobacterium sp. NPDC079362]|uniref:toxin-antitoxin system YwqK family antitoxin n=1 Tax=Flavobacterium sp. NPDC079362 TaxID=3390566 RepID=UPI003CFCC76E
MNEKLLFLMKFLSNMTSKIFSLILVFTTGLSFSQNAEPIYFDKNWKETSKAKASFYRINPSKKLDDLVLIEDFYLNKTPQFQGYSFQNDENSYVGDIVWYDGNGFDLSVYQFYNNSAASVLTYYYPDGKRLKTIPYKKGKKDGEHIVYHQDGTILIKGKYSKGKPVEGDFEEVRNWEDYRSNKSESEANEENELLTEATPVVEYSAGTKKKVITKIIKSKIFWINSKQLAQETWYDIEYDRMHRFKQVNYDVTGKILQTIGQADFEEYSGNISNGIAYEYYVQNQFAVAIKSKTAYKGREKSGEKIKYYPNGKIQEFTKYINGKIVDDEIVYDKNGTVMQKRTYKDGEPFEGNFNENFSGSLIINSNYVKGLKEGEAIVKTDEDSIVTKGIYKNNKPYKGTFIVKTGEDTHELIQVTDFKKNGLQKIFNYNIDNIIETYTCVNDIVDGETIFYSNGEITGKIEYKNGLPYNGKLVEGETATVYKQGAITDEIFYRNKYERTDENDILKSKSFTNGKLTKIVNSSFTIADKVQDSYEGIYKNEQPYSGYFSTEQREFNYVDYYENGIKKYQYSNNYLENLEKYQHPYYDIKSTYKEGKIIDGVEYIKLDRQFISKYWKNGVLQSYDVDLFAMHYFNRFHFELKNNSIEITEFKKKQKGRITREKIGDKYTSQLIIGDKVVMSSSSIDLDNEMPEQMGSIMYYESDQIIKAKVIDSKETDYEGRRESEMFYEIFASTVNSSKTTEENFNSIAQDFSTSKNIEAMFGKGDNADVLTGLRFNELKKPEMGILVVKSNSTSYNLKSFFDGKVLEEKKNIDIKNIREEVKKLNSVLEKKLNESFK